MSAVEVIPAHTPAWLDEVRALFSEYADAIRIDLCFQNFTHELATLPGAYTPPRGRLLLARHEKVIAACAALRPIDAATCEMKRLYVRPAYRRRGIARRLSVTLLAAARDIGYRRVRLDTLASMTEAIALYRSLGFVETAPYYSNPLPGATFMALDLSAPLPP